MKKAGKFISVGLALCAAALIFGACTQPTTPSDPTTQVETRNFWVNDNPDNPKSDGSVFVQIQAELAYQTERCNVWVRNNSDKNLVSADLLKVYGDYFTNHSWPDVTSYVNMPTEFFGEKGNRINILFYRAADGVAGYFWSKDFMSDTTAQDYGLRSNETNVFYLNIDAAVDADDQAYATTFTKGTLSHEFQHMCNAHYFDFGDGQYKERTMDSWANEMCSTTTESIFADQYSVYVPVLNADVGTKKSFSQGKTDFLHWDNDFTQYTTAALLGGYILSQLPEANRPAFIRTFLDNTFLEDPTPAQYIEDQAETTYRSSVEDLILALQDSAVGFSTLYGTDWTTVSVNDTDNSGFAKDWAIVMKGFVSALTGKNADYNQYLKDVTSAENKAYVPAPSIPLAAAATTTVALKASAFVVGKTKVASTASVSLGDASTTGTDAYVIVWNGLIPALPNPWSSEDETYTLPTGTANLTGVLLKPETSAPESRGFIGYGFRFDRTNSRPAGSVSVATFRVGASSPAAARTTDIAGVGDSSNPAITGGGNLACVYLAY